MTSLESRIDTLSRQALPQYPRYAPACSKAGELCDHRDEWLVGRWLLLGDGPSLDAQHWSKRDS